MCRVEEHHCLLVLDILPSGDSGTRKFIRTPCRGGLDSQAAVMCSVKARQEYRRQIHAIHVAEKREPTATATSCSRFDRTKHVELDTGQSLAICKQKWSGRGSREGGDRPASQPLCPDGGRLVEQFAHIPLGLPTPLEMVGPFPLLVQSIWDSIRNVAYSLFWTLT